MHEYVTQPLHRAIQRHPDRMFTTYADRSRTVRESVERISRLAAGLQKLGMKPGDRVGMLSLNSDRYIEYFFAVPWGGGVVNPCNTRWSVEEVLYSLDDCETTYLFADDNFRDAAADLRKRSKSLRHVIYTGDGPTPQGMIAYEALIADSAPIPDIRRGGDELLGVFYTGGTTGFPKGVMISHRGFIASSMAVVSEGVCPPRRRAASRGADVSHGRLRHRLRRDASGCDACRHSGLSSGAGPGGDRTSQGEYRAARADDDPGADQPSCGEDGTTPRRCGS